MIAVLSKTLLSEVTLVDKDFDSYRIVDGTQELIYPLKELKAVIGLAEALSLPISMHFNAEAGTYEIHMLHHLSHTIGLSYSPSMVCSSCI